MYCNQFKAKLYSFLIDILKQHHDYIDIPQITAALKKHKYDSLFSTQVDEMVDAYMLFFSRCYPQIKLSSVELI